MSNNNKIYKELNLRLEQLTAKALKLAWDDKYILSVAVSQRSNELADGAKPLLNIDPKKVKFSELAIREIASGVLKIDSLIDKE